MQNTVGIGDASQGDRITRGEVDAPQTDAGLPGRQTLLIAKSFMDQLGGIGVHFAPVSIQAKWKR